MSEPKSDKKPKPDEIKNQPAREPNYRTVITSVLLLVLRSFGNSERDKAAEQDQQRVSLTTATNKVARYTKWLVFATFASVVAAFASVATAIGSLCILSNQWHEMQKAYGPLKESADAARKSADVAKRAVDVTISTERPYLYILSVAMDPAMKPQEPSPKINYGFINVGRSPTVVRVLSVDCYLSDLIIPLVPQYRPEKAHVIENGMTSGAIFSTTSAISLPQCVPEKPLTPEDWAEIAARAKQISFIGYITYDGPFGEEYTRGFASTFGLGQPPTFHDVTNTGYNYDVKRQ
jgi:hypothetical protein